MVNDLLLEVFFRGRLKTHQICFRDHKPIGAAIYLGPIDAFINLDNEDNMEQFIFEVQYLADAAVSALLFDLESKQSVTVPEDDFRRLIRLRDKCVSAIKK